METAAIAVKHAVAIENPGLYRFVSSSTIFGLRGTADGQWKMVMVITSIPLPSAPAPALDWNVHILMVSEFVTIERCIILPTDPCCLSPCRKMYSCRVCVFRLCCCCCCVVQDVPILRHPARGQVPLVHIFDVQLCQERLRGKTSAQESRCRQLSGGEEVDGRARGNEGERSLACSSTVHINQHCVTQWLLKVVVVVDWSIQEL